MAEKKTRRLLTSRKASRKKKTTKASRKKKTTKGKQPAFYKPVWRLRELY